MKIETIVLNKERHVTLTAMIQDVGGEYRNVTARPAIVVIPGGGYMFCSDREAEPVALEYLRAGFNAFILRYSIGKDSAWPQPLNDYDEAMEYIIEHADEWHVIKDKIAVAGFSAGGHLAGAAATLAKHRPVAAILGYPVVNEQIIEINQNAPSIVASVDSQTSPCFIFATRTDNVVKIQNSIDMLNALNKHGISFETHIYNYGPHGFSTGDFSIQAKNTLISSRAKNWVSDSISWLRDMVGDFGTEGLEKPRCKAHMTDDGEAWLSLDCTIGRVLGNPEAVRVLDDVIAEMKDKITPFSPDMTFDDMMQVLSSMKLRDLLAERGLFIEEFDQLDKKLGKIPNI